MELDFDKEINALLRQAARSGEFVSANAENHLDADELSAFAENALPEKTRGVYIKHLADCDRCRTILSNTIVLNSEAETKTVSSPVAAPIAPEIVETNIPWYRKMFLMPNLAYTMGALVLAFGGAFGFLVLQNISQSTGSDVSQIRENEAGPSGPSAGDFGASYNSNAVTMSNSAMSNAANAMTANANATAADTSANVRNSPAETAANEPSTATAPDESGIQNQALARQKSENDLRADGVESNKAARIEEQSADKDKKDAELPLVDSAQPPAASPAKPAAQQSPVNSKELRRAAPDAAMSKNSDGAGASESENTRRIGGKTFNRVGGVWIDSAYAKSGSRADGTRLPATRAIRRGSSEYQKLDKQIRIIAESLSGAVIIVWRGGAYRIQ